MGRLEREIKNHPGRVAKDAFGPYIGWIALVAGFGWPFFVFHGAARLAVGIPWLIIAAITLAVIIGSRRAAPSRQPAMGQQRSIREAMAADLAAEQARQEARRRREAQVEEDQWHGG